MSEPFTMKAQFFFIPKVGVMDDVENAFLDSLILWVRRVVTHAQNHHPYTDRTGDNTAGIGWAAIKDGTQIGGTLEGAAAGDVLVPITGGTSIARGAGGRFASMGGGSRPTVVAGSSSGYGGFLEVGTINMKPYPYIKPAMAAELPALESELTGII